jgi:hypothetical protein
MRCLLRSPPPDLTKEALRAAFCLLGQRPRWRLGAGGPLVVVAVLRPSAAAGVDQAAARCRCGALVDVGQRLESNNHAANTKKAYARDFTHLADWCATVPLPALPATPETVYLYLSALVADDNAAGYAVSTLDRRLAAIGWVHDEDQNGPGRRRAGARRLRPSRRAAAPSGGGLGAASGALPLRDARLAHRRPRPRSSGVTCNRRRPAWPRPDAASGLGRELEL